MIREGPHRPEVCPLGQAADFCKEADEELGEKIPLDIVCSAPLLIRIENSNESICKGPMIPYFQRLKRNSSTREIKLAEPLFSRRLDRFSLGFPLFLFCLYFLANLMPFEMYKTTYNAAFVFLVHMFFLDTLHIFLTWIFLFNTQEGYQWMQGYFRKSTYFSVLILAISFFLMFSVFNKMITFENLGFILPILLFARAFLARQHQISQIRGLSFLLDFKYYGRGIEQEFLSQTHHVEKIVNWIFLMLAVILSVVLGVEYFNSYLFPFREGMAIAYVVVWCGAFFWLQFSQWQHEKEHRWKKIIFNLRYLVYLLLIQNYFLAAWASQILHGVDATCVYRNLLKASSKRFFSNSMVISVVFALVAIAGFVGLFQPFSSPKLFVVIFTLYSTQAFLHYIFERWLFGMKNPISRQKIMPLLYSSSS